MRTQDTLDEDTSLETLQAFAWRTLLDEPTEQDRFDQLVRAMADVRPEDHDDDGFVHTDEFTCRRCHLIVHRTRASRRVRMVCADCAH